MWLDELRSAACFFVDVRHLCGTLYRLGMSDLAARLVRDPRGRAGLCIVSFFAVLAGVCVLQARPEGCIRAASGRQGWALAPYRRPGRTQDSGDETGLKSQRALMTCNRICTDLYGFVAEGVHLYTVQFDRFIYCNANPLLHRIDDYDELIKSCCTKQNHDYD
jgi:hypothetical protein